LPSGPCTQRVAVAGALTTGLTDETKNSLDALLKIAPEMTTTRLTWLRNASQSPAPTNILGLIERVEFLRKLGIDRERQQAIPASAFDRIAREALKISAQHFAEAVAPRRHALLTGAALSLETGLTDATLLMFDKLMGSLSRKAERRSQEKAAKSARALQEKLRALTGACTHIAISCACPALPNGTPVLATSFGSIGTLLAMDAGGFVRSLCRLPRDGPC